LSTAVSTLLAGHNKLTRHLPRHNHYLADAQLLVRDLQAVCWPLNFHVTLGGGVLNHGYSDKDIDIYILPFYAQTGQEHKTHNLAKLTTELMLVLGSPTRNYMAQDLERLSPSGEPYTDLSEQPTCFAVAQNYKLEKMSVDVFVVQP
jgi:hypothetical protein